MKNLKLLCIILLSGMIMSACTEQGEIENPPSELIGAEYYKENVSLFDARVRSLLNENYVQELYFADFGETPRMPAYVNFNNEQYVDNGEGFDLKAGDGIYTSVRSFLNEKFTFKEGAIYTSVLDAPMLYHDEFTHLDKLNALSQAYELRKLDFGNRVDIVSCSASIELGTNDCLAAQWGWCSDCCVTVTVDLDDCEVGF